MECRGRDLTVLESVDAWHARFESREERMYFYKIENLNTTAKIARICNKIIPYTNVTIATDNNTTIPLKIFKQLSNFSEKIDNSEFCISY